MARISDINDVYDRMQRVYKINKRKISQTEVIDFLTGKTPSSASLSSKVFAEEVEGLAVEDLKPIINQAETLQDFIKLEDIEIQNSKEQIKERRKEVEINLVQEVKTKTGVSEFEDAVESLRELNPRRLGGIRSGQTRRAQKGFRVLFSEV